MTSSLALPRWAVRWKLELWSVYPSVIVEFPDTRSWKARGSEAEDRHGRSIDAYEAPVKE